VFRFYPNCEKAVQKVLERASASIPEGSPTPLVRPDLQFDQLFLPHSTKLSDTEILAAFGAPRRDDFKVTLPDPTEFNDEESFLEFFPRFLVSLLDGTHLNREIRALEATLSLAGHRVIPDFVHARQRLPRTPRPFEIGCIFELKRADRLRQANFAPDELLQAADQGVALVCSSIRPFAVVVPRRPEFSHCNEALSLLHHAFTSEDFFPHLVCFYLVGNLSIKRLCSRRQIIPLFLVVRPTTWW